MKQMPEGTADHTDDQPLRIAIGCDTFPPDINGAARFAERLAGGLARKGHEVHVFAPSTNKRFGTYREIHDGVPIVVHRLKSYAVPGHKSLRFASPIGLRSKLGRLIARIEPDAIHIQSHLLVGRYLSLVATDNRIRLIATNHTMPENLIKYAFWIPKFLAGFASRLSWRDTERVLLRAEAVTTPTATASAILANSTAIDNALAISCGIDASQFATAGTLVSDPPIALYVGRLDFEKRVQVLLEAFAKVPTTTRLKLAIVGDGSERKSLERWSEELGLADRVRFYGEVPDEELKRAYEGCTFFVMPSIAELQSIATMEAMASGRPILAANAAALPHLVYREENGVLFEADDVDDLAEKMTWMASQSQQKLWMMGQASLRRIQSHDIATTISRFEQLYRGELGVKPSSDNEDTYTQPIRLTEQDSYQLRQFAVRARTIRDGAKRLASGVIARLDESTGDVIEKFEDIRFDVIRRSLSATKTVERSIRKALARFRGGRR
jgi:glycosyltransferase involved in cell wall biosynthesis